MYKSDLAYIHDVAFSDFAEAVAPEIMRTLRRAGIGGGRIVEFGCGSGILAALLHRSGYDVTAFDISPAMIRLARKKTPGVRFQVASLRSVRIPSCDAVVGIGEVVTYVSGGRDALRRFFSRAYSALQPGGLLIFDFLESASRRTYPTKTLTGSDWTLAVSATFNQSRRVLTRRMTIARQARRGVRRSRETHHVRVFDRRTIQHLLKQCGFAVAMRRSYGRYRLLPGDVAVVAHRLPKSYKSHL
jgi:SAM-dependent methyltransferase